MQLTRARALFDNSPTKLTDLLLLSHAVATCAAKDEDGQLSGNKDRMNLTAAICDAS